MNLELNAQMVKLSRRIIQIIGICVSMIGGIVLVGWIYEIEILKNISSGLVTMKPNTAIAFVFSGFALWLGAVEVPSRTRILWMRVCAAVPSLIGALTLAEYLLALDLGIDQLLFVDSVSLNNSYPGRMSIVTALSFSLLGVSFLLIYSKWKDSVSVFQNFALLAWFISGVALTGYIYDVRALYSVGPFSSMALNTAICFFLLAMGILLMRPGKGYVTIFFSNSVGGVSLRRIFPIIVIVPLLLSILVLEGEKQGFYNLRFGLAIMVVLSFSIQSFFLWAISGRLNQMDEERISADKQTRHFARLYAVLSQVNQTIVRTKDRQALFDAICKVSVDYGNFRLAWIGLYDDETDLLTPVAECGAVDNPLPFGVMKIKETPHKEGLIGLALRSGLVEFSDDVQVDPRMPHWRDAAIRGDYHSAAVIPFHQKGQVIGFLSLYVADINFFAVEEERKLLEEMGSDISFALETMQLEVERQQAESKIYYQASLLKNVTDAIVASDAAYVLTAWNAAAEAMYGWKAEEVLGRNGTEILKTELPDIEKENMLRILREQGIYRGEATQLRKDGTRFPVEIGSIVLRDDQGQITGYASVNRDITERKQSERELHRAEERFHKAFYSGPVGLAITRASDGVYLEINDAFSNIVGFSHDEIIGQTSLLLNITTLEQREKYTSQISRDGFINNQEMTLRNRSGEFRTVLGSMELIELNQEVCVLSTAVDITERKKIEANLMQSEQRFRQLADNIEEVFWIFDISEKRLIYISPVIEKIWMLPAHDFFENPNLFMESLVPEDRPRVEEIVRRQFQGEKTEVEYRISRPDGSIRWIWDRAFPVFDEDGNLTRITGVVADISKNKKAEMELLELNQSLERRIRERTTEVQDLYENAPAGYHSLDSNGVFVRINQTELTWLGYSREEVVGIKSFGEIITAESKKIFAENFPRFKAQGWIKDLEFEFIRKDGSTFPILLNSTAIYNEQGQYVMSRSTLFDLTERKQVELKLHAANTMLEKASKLKDEFLASMSHELRTPLNAVISLSESLQEGTYGELPPRQKEILDVISESGHHLLDLINDILDLSKIEAGRLDLQMDPVELDTFCQASLRMIGQAASQKQLTVSTVIDPELKIVYADGRRLKQMLVNLLSNAVKFTPGGGQIGVKITREGEDAIRFTVWDTGIGIPEDKLSDLFNPFVQLDSSLSRQYSGTGLGLALVRQLAELHGGGVGVTSTPGEGSIFYFIIPSLPFHQNISEALPQAPQHPSVEDQPSQSFAKILLVEDNEINMLVTSDYLTNKGYTIIKAVNGFDAIEKAQTSKPELILMDIQMPRMNGLDAIRRLRAEPEFATVPIIALTALVMPGDRERCLEAGANEYLAKPISLKRLVETINALLNSHRVSKNL